MIDPSIGPYHNQLVLLLQSTDAEKLIDQELRRQYGAVSSFNYQRQRAAWFACLDRLGRAIRGVQTAEEATDVELQIRAFWLSIKYITKLPKTDRP